MFGRKQKRIEALEERCALFEQRLYKSIKAKDGFSRELREMDNLVFQMANQPDWPTMRPFFQQMSTAAMKRKEAESNRITGIMIPELERTYGQT